MSKGSKQHTDNIRFPFQKDESGCRIKSKGARLNGERVVRKWLQEPKQGMTVT